MESRIKILEKEAVDIMLKYQPSDETYYLAYSGGKDSDVIKHIAKKINLKVKIVHSFTTIGAKAQIRYVLKQRKDIEIIYPKKSFYQLVEEKGLPTRMRRWCCEHLKHYYGKGKLTITGVRKDESSDRFERTKEYQEFGGKTKRVMIRTVNPILNWTDKDVWNYINQEKITYNELYDKGYKRIGCVGCTLAKKYQREREFKENPGVRKAIINSYSVYLKKQEAKGITNGFKNALDGFTWWMGQDKIKTYLTKTKNSLFVEDFNLTEYDKEAILNAIEKNDMKKFQRELNIDTNLNISYDFNQFINWLLHLLILKDRNEMAKLLIELDHVNLDVKNNFGATPLHYASSNNNVEIVKLLLENGANPNSVNSHLETPLHLAVGEGADSKVVSLLLDYNASTHMFDDENQTPLDIANYWNEEGILLVD